MDGAPAIATPWDGSCPSARSKGSSGFLSSLPKHIFLYYIPVFTPCSALCLLLLHLFRSPATTCRGVGAGRPGPELHGSRPLGKTQLLGDGEGFGPGQ